MYATMLLRGAFLICFVLSGWWTPVGAASSRHTGSLDGEAGGWWGPYCQTSQRPPVPSAPFLTPQTCLQNLTLR